MEFLYCFANTSLTQRVLDYLLRQMKLQVDAVTVIFLNDCWVVQLKLDLAADAEHWANCWAVLNENGIPYQPTTAVALALRDLRAGCSPIEVMNRHHLSIVSHGQPQPDAVDCFQEIFVAGLGYCPPSLI